MRWKNLEIWRKYHVPRRERCTTLKVTIIGFRSSTIDIDERPRIERGKKNRRNPVVGSSDYNRSDVRHFSQETRFAATQNAMMRGNPYITITVLE